MNITSSYFMHDSREAKRLADKVDADAWVARYLNPLLSQGENVLDVGCGPGVLAIAAARANPSCHFTGIDLYSERFESLSRPFPDNVRFSTGDANELPFTDASFDLVYCRFLLEYLPNKQRALSEMVRVCRPGGVVLLQDLDGQLLWNFPEDTELQEQLTSVLKVFADSGFDPFVGRKLFSLADKSGLQALEVTAETYHLFAGAIDDRNLSLWRSKLEIAIPAATKALGSEDAAHDLKHRFLAYLQRKDTLTYSVVFTVLGRTPLSSQACDLH